MLKTFSVVLLTLAMSASLADARVLYRTSGHHYHHHYITIPGCTLGQSAMTTCACGTANGHPLVCHPGQWCHPSQACTS